MVLVHPQTAALDDDPALHDSDNGKSVHMELATPVQDSEIKSSDATEATASESDDEQQSLAAAKANLKSLLKKHGRSVKHPEVEKALDELVALNPTVDAALSPQLVGSFVSLTRPEFPGRLKQTEGNEHLDQYTLGRLSFNIFQPNDLVCTIVKTRNDLIPAPAEEQAGETKTFAYPLETHIIIHTPKGDFPASILMRAVCTSDKQPKNRLGVTFAGGTLTPAEEVRSDSNKLALWKQVFGDAYKKAEAERSYFSSLMQFVFKWLFQLTTPTDEDAESNETHSVSFEMKRCPHGYIDVMYLDEDLRITKGNRGTIVIVERTRGSREE